MNNQNNKKVNLTVMFVAILTIVVISTSFAFFNYTRTGGANTLKVGRISFNHTQDGSITLTNIFPMSSEEFENSTQDPSNNVTINIEGDTTYPNGVEYLVTAEDVNITVNDKRIPLTLKVTSTTDLGDNDEDYFTNRGGSTNIHKVLSGGVVVDGQYLVVGYIAPGQTGVEGSLNISAYINSDNIVISDTYDGTESDNMGTTNEWVGNKTVFTTSEWNSLSTSSNSLSFKIRVEANEGIWVDPYTTPNLMNTIGINRNAVNIKEIRFIEETPLRMQRRYDASVGQESNGTKSDLTYQDTGKVLAWIEPITVNPTGTSSNLNIKPSFLVNENTDNNLKQIDNETSYVLYIASSGKTKWVTGSSIFGGFTNVEKITFENVDSSDVTDMSWMFPNLSNLVSIEGINKLDTSNVTSMSYMFVGCSKLSSINLKGLNTSKVENMSSMFINNSSLTSVNLTGLGSDNLTTVSNMFSGCTSLTNINMSNFNFGLTEGLGGLFSTGSTNNISEVKLNGSIMNNVTSMSNMFLDCTSLTSIDLSGLGSNSLTSVGGMFSNCQSLIAINMSNFNFGLTEGLGGLFSTGSTNNISEINLSGTGSDNLTSVEDMFSPCISLKKIDMSNFNFGTSSLSSLFNTNYNLENINLNNAITTNISDFGMRFLFDGLSKLKTINLTGIDTSNQTSFQAMFRNCSSLTTLDLTSFDTKNVTAMNNMFSGCTNLKNIDLSSFNTISLTNAISMFSNCSSLQTIYSSNTWDTSNVTSSDGMFSGCNSLVGGNGTVFDSTKTDKTMAVIDTPTTPGYLTLKQA